MKANVNHTIVHSLSPLSKNVFSFSCKSETEDTKNTVQVSKENMKNVDVILPDDEKWQRKSINNNLPIVTLFVLYL